MNDKFRTANLTFLYQIVYDPFERKMKPLNPYADDVDGIDLSFAGEVIIDEEVAFDYALGNLNISGRKLDKVTSYDPETAPIVDNPSYGKRASHSSIWTKKYSKKVSSAAQNTNKVDLSLHTGPVPKKQPVNREIRDSKPPKNTHNRNDDKIQTPKSSTEKVYYISKYFKDKIFREDETGKTVAICHDTHASNKEEENNSEDVLNIYKDKPKSIVDSPGTKMDRTVTTKVAIDSTVMINENQENILGTLNSAELMNKSLPKTFPEQPIKSPLIVSSDKLNTEKVRRNSDKQGDWLEELEKDTAVIDTKVIYNTHSIWSKSENESLEHNPNMSNNYHKNDVGDNI